LRAIAVSLLLDGLDEIPDAAFRAKIVQQIEALTQSYPQNHFIVTSRIVGYKEAPLATDYQPYTLADFNQQQIKTFTRKWCPAYESWVRGTTDQQILQEAETTDAERLFQATQCNPGVKKLAVNPLLLTILALIQRQGIELPSHRVELFYRCTETLLETWITAKGQALPFSKIQLIKILRPLAFWMHQQRTVGAIPEEDLAEHIVKQLLDRKITADESEALKLAEAFLKTVRGQTGILIERGKERYGFLHQAFEEYFAARELEKRPDRNDFIKQHLHEARWREVILLTAGAIGILHSNEEGVTELVQDVIMQALSPFEEWLHRDLLFAGLCLADDIGVSISCENEIVEEIVLLYLISPYDSLRVAFSDVLVAWNGTPVGRKAARLILSMFRKKEMLTRKATTDTTLQPLEITFQEKIREYYQHILHQILQALARLQCLQIIMLLHRLQIEQDIIKFPVEYGLEQLSDSVYIVREAAANLLGQLGKSQPVVIDGLVKTLSDLNEDVRKAAASALGQLNNVHSSQPVVVKALLHALTDSSEEVRQAAALALGKTGDTQPEVVEALLHTLTDSDPDVSQASVSALGQLSNLQPAVAENLIHALAESDWRIREGIAKIFGELSNAKSDIIEALIHILPDPNNDVRQAVIVSLGRLGVAQNPVLDALFLALSNRTWQVRHAAAIALGQLGNSQPEVVKTLAHALSDANEDVRLAAATALGYISNTQPEVIEALLCTLSDSDDDVRQAAAAALKHVETTQPSTFRYLLATLSNVANLCLPQKLINEFQQELYKAFTQRQAKLLGKLGTGYSTKALDFATIANRGYYSLKKILETLWTILECCQIDHRVSIWRL
jgi:HEAT repeat protein